jgi:hypothetical protein
MKKAGDGAVWKLLELLRSKPLVTFDDVAEAFPEMSAPQRSGLVAGLRSKYGYKILTIRDKGYALKE